MATSEEIAAAADDALIQSLQTGQSVQFNGRTWTSHDLEKLLAVRAAFAVTSTAPGTSSSRLAAYRKGV